MGYLRGGATYPRSSYLRGTMSSWAKGRGSYSKPTLENRLKRLQREVLKHKPSVEEFTDATTITHTGPGYLSNTYTITQDTKDDVDFRNKINGQDFLNRRLKVRLQGAIGIDGVRVIIYVPNDPNDSFTPGASSAGMTVIPSFKKHKVLYDGMMTVHDYNLKPFQWIDINLRDALTRLAENGDVEKCNIKMTVISHADVAVSLELYRAHYVTDK